MFNFLSSCGICSNVPRAGDYAYEVFNKVPTIGGIFGNLSDLTQKIAPIKNLIGNIGGFGSLINPQNSASNSNQFDISKFINNVPTNSVIAGDSTFKDLISNQSSDGVIKKVLKSNYSQLIKEHG